MSPEDKRDILEAVHGVRERVISLEVRFDEYKDRIDSDIKALRGGHREAMQSVTDLKEQEAAEVKESHERLISGLGKVGMVFVACAVGWLFAHFTK